ncbi:hypothetical protein B0A50_07074 [Salinomyces thailandicus]|uniref:Rhodopsin domain-containing protein n=1 Tax=Salinomyces thailandicus TaxID=706561 RepID=A0A4U0TPR3_9PEZI|nr:hypothetical protein B0A50_07074 [Salinomyces thailandica]
MLKSLGWDDWLMLLTNCVYTMYCIFVILAEHTDQDGLAKLDMPVSYFLAGIALYIVTTVLFKAALGLFYLRIVISSRQRYIIYATMAISITFGTVYFFFTLFQCGDPNKLMQNRIEGECVSNTALLAVGLSEGLVNALADWVLALLPIFVLRNASNIRFAAKVSASLVILLGAAGSVCSVVRLAFIDGYAPGNNFFLRSTRFTVWIRESSGRRKGTGSSMSGSGEPRQGGPRQDDMVPLSGVELPCQTARPSLEDLEMMRDERGLATVIGDEYAVEKMAVMKETDVHESAVSVPDDKNRRPGQYQDDGKEEEEGIRRVLVRQPQPIRPSRGRVVYQMAPAPRANWRTHSDQGPWDEVQLHREL